MKEVREKFIDEIYCVLQGICSGECSPNKEEQKKKCENKIIVTERLLGPYNLILRPKRKKLARIGDILCRNHLNLLGKQLIAEKRRKNAEDTLILEMESARLEISHKKYQIAQETKIIDDNDRFHH